MVVRGKQKAAGIAHAVALQQVTVVPEFLNDGGGVHGDFCSDGNIACAN